MSGAVGTFARPPLERMGGSQLIDHIRALENDLACTKARLDALEDRVRGFEERVDDRFDALEGDGEDENAGARVLANFVRPGRNR